MSILVALAVAVLSITSFVRSQKNGRLLAAEVAALGERVRELQTRVDAAEADVAHAVTQTDIAESLLLEKGIADEEDIEAVRRRFGDADATPSDVGSHDGELH